MKWSKLKKRIELTFADSVAGRVEFWTTRYRHAHDEEGEAWVTIDKKRVWSMGSYTFMDAHYSEAKRLQVESECEDYRDPEQREGYYNAYDQARENTHQQGVFASWDVNDALFEYLKLSIADCLHSDNPIIRAVAMLDRRMGKRRLKGFDDTSESELVKLLYRFRCEAEGISP